MTADTQPEKPKGKRLGVARGLLKVPDNVDEDNGEIARLFEEGEIFPPERPATDES